MSQGLPAPLDTGGGQERTPTPGSFEEEQGHACALTVVHFGLQASGTIDNKCVF